VYPLADSGEPRCGAMLRRGPLDPPPLELAGVSAVEECAPEAGGLNRAGMKGLSSRLDTVSGDSAFCQLESLVILTPAFKNRSALATYV